MTEGAIAQARPRPLRGVDRITGHTGAGRRHREARLRLGVGGRVPGRGPLVRRADPREDREPPGGHRHRERLDRRRRRGRDVVPPHREGVPRPVPARRRHRAPRAHRGVPQAVRRAGGVPRRARRREGADQPDGRRGARTEGAEALGAAQRRRAPVPDHAGAHRLRPANCSVRQCFWRPSTRSC